MSEKVVFLMGMLRLFSIYLLYLSKHFYFLFAYWDNPVKYYAHAGAKQLNVLPYLREFVHSIIYLCVTGTGTYQGSMQRLWSILR